MWVITLKDGRVLIPPGDYRTGIDLSLSVQEICDLLQATASNQRDGERCRVIPLVAAT